MIIKKTGFIWTVLVSVMAPAAQADFGISRPMPSLATSQITRTVSDNIAKNLFDNLIIPQLKIRNSSGQIKHMRLSSDKRFLSLVLEDGSARVWDLELGVQRPMVKLSSGKVRSVVMDAKQQILFSAGNKLLEGHNVLTANEKYRLPIQQEEVKSLELSTDAGILLVNAENNLTLWNLKDKTRLWRKSINEGGIITAKLVPGKQYAVLHKRQASLFSTKDTLEIVSLKTGETIQTLSNDDKQLVSFGLNGPGLEVAYRDGQLVLWDIKTGKQLSSKNVGFDITALDGLSDGVYAFVNNDGQVVITNQQGQQLVTIQKEDVDIKSVALLQNGKRVITAMDNGQVLVWDTSSGKELAQLISTKQGWTVLDSVGRFDSSEKGMVNVSWEAADQDIPLDSFSGKYYEPGLLMTVLTGGEYINKDPNAVQQGITLPPKLDVVVRDVKTMGDKVELTVDVFGQGGGIGKVNFYHNAKAVVLNKILQDDKQFVEQERQRRTMRLVVDPVSGENTIKVVAANKMGIEGAGAEAQFKVEKAAPPSLLRVVTIGVNQYQDQRLNLDYSVADAETISRLMSTTDLVSFEQTAKYNLYNANATKLSILSTLREVSQGAQEDVMAIYFAGHGLSVKGEWYFLPHETTLQPDMNYFTTVGISATELSEIFMDSSIQHIFLMVDACYSGESVSSFRRLQNSQRHFSRDISRSVGITVLTATRRDQEAAELSDLGHGLFTYVVTKGMQGDADWWPKNNQVSAHELATFSTKTIPEFSKKYLQAAQEPTAFTMGKDFPLFNAK